MSEKEVRLQVRNISKTFGITKALKDVSFDLYKGEIHALIGENGSGKSTLTNMLTGIYSMETGKFILDGEEVHPKDQVDANDHGISIIVQEQGTLDGLTVAENIFLGHEQRFIKGIIRNTGAMNKAANDLLKKYGFERIKANRMVDDYNFEDRKLVEIVKATYFEPKVVVVDETTTALSQEGREELYKHMRRIRDYGGTVIFISHDLDEVLNMSDTITILRDGDYIDTVDAKDVTSDDLKRLMVGREVTGNYYRSDYGEKVSDEVVLSAKNVSVPGLIDDINLDLHKGEILGIGGLSESGMHEVGKALFGASYDRTGEVVLGDGTHINDIPTAIRHSIAYTSKDRDNESVVMNQSIGDNITLPSLGKLTAFGPFISDRKKNAFANKYAKEISVKMVNINQFVSKLSGGNKQKVVLARWIGADSDILILDSPTRGIDIKVKQDIYQLMDSMRKQGKSVLMISEELMELIGMCDNILIMKDGKINGEVKRDPSVTENDLIAKMV
ncbi:MAG: sugar ABC transporter ATP-binding protein [Lachnospiraceae bacterium]|jgi:ribose transport system ATP-binding protein|nr:sugar ABC transporter ATP-binding protein [Lachnospiraceae bacterium]